jgi:hypothetical protein
MEDGCAQIQPDYKTISKRMQQSAGFVVLLLLLILVIINGFNDHCAPTARPMHPAHGGNSKSKAGLGGRAHAP